MKKLLLATALAAIASSAVADENMFYVRADAGAAMLPKGALIKGAKLKTHPVVGLGVGTYLMDNVRTELNFVYHINPEQKISEDGDSVKVKAKAMGVNLKGLVDVVDTGYGKVFAGAGVGYSQVSAKITVNEAAVPATDLVPAVPASSTSSKAKKKNNFSWLATAGMSFDVADGVMLDVAYTYSDHGKTKAVDEDGPKAHLKSHNVTAGVRIEL